MAVETIGNLPQPQAETRHGNDRHRQQGGGLGKACLAGYRLPGDRDGAQCKRLACILQPVRLRTRDGEKQIARLHLAAVQRQAGHTAVTFHTDTLKSLQQPAQAVRIASLPRPSSCSILPWQPVSSATAANYPAARPAGAAHPK